MRTYELDVSSKEAVLAHADEVLDDFGAAHYLFNNAGVTLAATIEHATIEEYEWLLGINLWGPIYGTKAFLPAMLRQGEGHIVNFSSVFGLVAVPTQSAYHVSKFGIRGFTECLSRELDGTGVYATCVHPGGIATNIGTAARFGVNADSTERKFMNILESMLRTTADDCVRNDPRRASSGASAGSSWATRCRQLDWLSRLLPTHYEQSCVASRHLTRRSMMIEHLTPTDASMLAIEDPDHGMHLQIIYVFEGEPPTFEEFRQTVEERLLGAPRFRQRVAKVPFGLGRPAWVDDERFDLDYHLRRTALPAPGSEEELRTLSNRLLQQPLDLRRALWEMWLVEGLADGRFAIIHRVHHCMVDGVATQDISRMMFSSTPHEERPAETEWRPAGTPGGSAAGGIGSGRLRREDRRGKVSGILKSARSPLTALKDTVQSARTLGTVSGVTGSVPNDDAQPAAAARGAAPTGCACRWTTCGRRRRPTTRRSTTSCSLRAPARCAATSSATAQPIPDGMRAMVPVSVRLDDERGRPEQPGVRDLPGPSARARPTPAERVALVAAEVDRLKGTQGVAMQRIMDLGGFAPPTIMEQVQRLLLVNDGRAQPRDLERPGPAQAALSARPAAGRGAAVRADDAAPQPQHADGLLQRHAVHRGQHRSRRRARRRRLRRGPRGVVRRAARGRRASVMTRSRSSRCPTDAFGSSTPAADPRSSCCTASAATGATGRRTSRRWPSRTA